jgi:L-iditol 2-dehydrogenase
VSTDSAIAPSAAAKSQQAMLIAPGHLELRSFDPPHPGPGEVLIEVKCALSCGTDLKTYRRGHPLWRLPTPFGHEFSGIVVEAGADTNFKVGDALMAAPTAPCRACFFCQREQENLCHQVIDTMLLGAYANYLLVPAHIIARNAFHKPPALPFEEAALLEPLACVVHANEMAHPQQFETVLIIGAGPFGLLHLLMLKSQGVREVVVAGRRDNRLKAASDLGADRVIDVDRNDPSEIISGLNAGHGPDLVIESTGQLKGWEDAFRWVRRGGRVLFFGGCPLNTTLAVDTRRMHYDNLTLLAPFHYRPRDVARTFELLRSDALRAGRIIDSHRPLSELGEVFSLLERGAVLKCAVIP